MPFLQSILSNRKGSAPLPRLGSIVSYWAVKERAKQNGIFKALQASGLAFWRFLNFEFYIFDFWHFWIFSILIFESLSNCDARVFLFAFFRFLDFGFRV